MICDTLAQSELYFATHLMLARGLRWLQSAAIGSLPKGKHEIEGDSLFAMVDEYETRPLDKTRFESHQIYGDIQLIVSGREAIDVCDIGRLNVSEEYNAQRDVGFFVPPGSATRLILNASDFAVFFPNDGHRPQIAVELPLPVRKIVVKFRYAT